MANEWTTLTNSLTNSAYGATQVATAIVIATAAYEAKSGTAPIEGSGDRQDTAVAMIAARNLRLGKVDQKARTGDILPPTSAELITPEIALFIDLDEETPRRIKFANNNPRDVGHWSSRVT